MKRPAILLSCTLLTALGLSAVLGLAGARPVALGGVMTSPRTETKPLSGGTEGLPVWFLPRLGVTVQNSAGSLSLSYAGRSLNFVSGRWLAQNIGTVPAVLPVPELYGGSLHVGVSVLAVLGVPVLADTPDVLDYAPAGAPGSLTGEIAPVGVQPQPVAPPLVPVPPVTQPPVTPSPVTQPPAPQPPIVQPPQPPFTPLASLTSVRRSRSLDRNIELQRVVLELSAPVAYTVARDRSGLSISLPGVSSGPQTVQLESGDDLGVSMGAAGSTFRLDTRGGVSEVFTLPDPARIVIDTTTNVDSSVPPPVQQGALPDGVTLRKLGGLSLLTFDARYAPRVVAAPLGRASAVADLVKAQGGVAGVNGGYFDPSSSLPVDLVALGGLMVAPSLEKRATLGLDAQGAPKLGYPRPRYVLSAPGLQLTVNSVGARPNPLWVTAFVGDGHTQAGGDGLTTLVLQGGLSPLLAPAGTVARALSGRFVPAAGDFAVTFDPARYPGLALPSGSPLSYSLNWQTPGWDGVQQALAAGPLLVSGGKLALDPAREGFDTSGSIWRATRQVAFITVGDRTGVAFLDNGTPGDFARALVGAGVSSAMRLDSGSSATVYVTGGYLNAGGYLNTVWSRPVPNALVFVPRVSAQAK